MAEAGQNLANNYRGHPGDGIVDDEDIVDIPELVIALIPA
jgi:hypothetical protein